MSTSKTQNYALHSWAPADEFHVSEINENFTALDTALKAEADTAAQQLAALQGAVAQKAEASAVTALQSTVSAKADSATVTALQTAVNGKASASDLNSLKTTVNKKANTSDLNTVKSSVPRYLFGKYAGTGDENSQTISLGVDPKVVFVSDSYGSFYSSGYLCCHTCMAFLGYNSESGALDVHSGGFTVFTGRGTYLNETGSNYYYLVWY